MKKIYSLLLLVFVLQFLKTNTAFAQSGTDFWFAPPDITDLHNPPGGEPIYLLLSSTGAAATVTVSQPANGSFIPIVVNIAANKSARINLTAFKTSLETRPTNTITNTGLRIQSTTAITAYYDIANTNNSKIFALKGPNGLGTEFYIPLPKYAPFFNHTFASPHKANATFDIVASQNSTTVTIYSPVAVDGHPALTQFSITLNAGQSYSCGFTGINYEQPSTHPGGAVVLSDKPIAITIKDDSDHNPSGGCYDLTGDQIVPVNVLGNDYVAVKGGLNNTGDESLFITATENNTQVYIDGSAVPAITLFAGESYRIDMDYLAASANNSVYAHTNKPAYALHVTGFGCEMGSAILPPLNCAGSSSISFVRSTSESFFVTLLARTTTINNFTITGSGTAVINPAAFVTVPGTGGVWMAAKIQYNTTEIPVDSAFRVSNSADVFALGIINGGATTGCKYGYFSEFVAPIIVSANVDQTVCANDTAQLSGAITGGASAGIWTSSGTGAFVPNASALNAKYVPSAADIAATTVTLTLTSTSICSPQSDQMIVTFTPAPTANAGVDQSICKNNPTVALAGSVTIATGGVWTGGAGTYNPNNNTLNAIYTPTAAELTAGSLVLTLTTTGNGTCNPVTDNVVITFTNSPTANAGPDQTICGNNAAITLGGSVTIATGGIWSGGGGSFNPSNTALNAVYTPTPAEIASGNLTLTLTTTGNGNCNGVNDQMTITFTLPPTANAGAPQTVCGNNATITLAGSIGIATGGQWSGGLGIYTPNNTTLNATYAPTAAEIASGSLMLTLTSTGNGNCSAVNSTVTFTFTPAPTVDAGINQTVCANNPNVTLNPSFTVATGVVWSGGSGTYNPNNTTANAIYTPSAAEITAGTAVLTATTIGNGTCNAVTDNVTITISSAPIVNAGVDIAACKNNATVNLSGSVTIAGGGIWSGGAGTYTPNNTTLNASYTPTAAEISAGNVLLTLTSTSNGLCNAVSDAVNITFSNAPIVNAGTPQTVCGNNAMVTLAGSVANATGGQWSGGLGVFSPNNTTLNATYTPTSVEIAAGSVTLMLTSTGNGNCNAVNNTVTITYTPTPTVDAGLTLSSCANNATVALNGSYTIASGILWSGGAGTYTPNNTTANANYTPSAAEIAAGTVTLTLTSTGNGLCLPVSDIVVITIAPTPIVNAGAPITSCKNKINVQLNGTLSNAGGAIWSGGAGSYSPNNTTLNATYTPTQSEINSGSLFLTLTSTGNGTCTAVTSNVTITFDPSPIALAGTNQIVCANNSAIVLNGAVTNAVGGIWTGGLGTFLPNNTTLNTTYTPTQTEINSGSLNLYLTTTGNGNCNAVSDTIGIAFTAAPTVDAGNNQTSCENNSTITLNGFYTIASGAIWSGGTGTFVPNNTTMNATYTPSTAEVTAGTAKIYLTTTGNGNCNAMVDSIILTIVPKPTVNAGSDQTTCITNLTVQLNGSINGITNTGIWSTSGTGSFSNTTILNPTYTCSSQDSINGSVTLILTSTNNGTCNPVKDSMILHILPAGLANAGNNVTVCANNASVSLSGAVSGGATGGTWSSNGSGVFSPNTATLNAIYIPSVADAAAGTVTLTLTANSCNNGNDQLVITITPAPIANAGIDQTICSSVTSVSLTGTVSGGTTTGVWSSTGTGTFTPNNTTLNATYTPSAADVSAQVIYLVLTSANNGTCVAVKDSMRLNIYPSAVALAGNDQTVCSNNANVVLNGSFTGGATTGIWSTSGTGIFNPSANTLNATYTPSAADIAAGSINLILSATNSCNVASDFLTVIISTAPTVNAGNDQTLCGSNPNVSLSGAITNAGAGIWSGGAGTFNPSSTTLNAIYTPTFAEIASGSLTLTLTSTANGICNAVNDQITITFTASIVTNAGVNQSVCKTSGNAQLQGIVSNGSTTGVWNTLGSGTFIPNDSALNAIYQFSAADTASGSVTLILTSTFNGSCAAAKDTMVITFGLSAFAYAGVNQTICSSTTIANLNGLVSGGATTGSWSTLGTGTFNPNNSTLAASYTLGATDLANGLVNLILTTTNNGGCAAGKDTMTVFVTNAATVFAGNNQSVCSDNAVVTLNGSVTGGSVSGIWSSNGSGTYNPNNTALNSNYTPSPADIANGSVQMVLTSTNNGVCIATKDTMVISITPIAIVNAGANQTLCPNSSSVTLNGSVSGGTSTGQWSTLGSGSFSPNTSTLNASYTPSAADILNGSIQLILTSTNNGACSAKQDTMLVTFSPTPYAYAGNDVTVCSNATTVALNGTINVGGGTGVWSTSGSGTFSPNNTSLITNYILGTNDASAGFVYAILTSTNNGACPAAIDSMVINVTPISIANASVDQTICSSNAIVNLNGSVSGGSATGQWTALGSGTFSPNNTTLNATYTASSSDISNASVTLILSTTNNGGCSSDSDTMIISINTAPQVFAGNDISICSSNTSLALNASINSASGTGVWTTSGSGTFSPTNTSLTTNYILGTSDTTAGFIYLILTSTNNGSCAADIDSMLVTITPAAIANAGVDQTICSSTAAISLNGNISGGSTTGQWSTLGSGNFSPNNTTLAATYTASSSDISNGSVTLILTTTNNVGCAADTDTMVVTFISAPQVFAGNDVVVCSGSNNIALNANIVGGSGTGIWTSNGSGVFSPNNNTLNATYILSAADIITGTVQLVLTTTNNGGCVAGTDTLKITIGTKPVAAFTFTVSGLSVNFADQSNLATTWLWDFGDNGGNSTQQNPTHVYNSSGVYPVTLIITSASGCADTATISIDAADNGLVSSPVAVPTGFTPNGDGINDYVPILGGPFETVELIIYNEWGNVIFKTTDEKIAWDGKYNGVEQSAGVYIYTAKGKTVDGKAFSFSGDVTLIK